MVHPNNPIPGGWRDVASCFDFHVAERPRAEALVGRFGRYAFGELDAAVNAGARALQALGVGPGDRVAASALNHPDIVIAFFATQRLGAIWVGINRALAGPEKAYQLEDSGARVFLADAAAGAQIEALASRPPALEHVIDMEPGETPNGWMSLIHAHAGAERPAVAIDPHAPAAIAYTSGTTGRPKGAVHSQHNMMVVAAIHHEGVRGAHWRPDLRSGSTLPLTILNLVILEVITPLSGGGACVCMDRADAVGVAEWIGREKVEVFTAAPATIFDLINRPEIDPANLASVVFVNCGGSTVSDELRRNFQQHFGAPLMGGYGLTEAPTAVSGHFVDPPSPPGSCGRCYGHLEIAALGPDDQVLPLGEAGEICFRAVSHGDWAGVYTPMLEYWGRPEETAALLRNGWLHTGDVGVLDAHGEMYLKDRLKELIIRGGSNIYPAEVERVLTADPRVRSAAVVGKADERLGEIVVAFVEVAPGLEAGEALEAELRAACLQELARYKVPEAWVFVPDMPRNSMNKIIKSQLRERLRSQSNEFL